MTDKVRKYQIVRLIDGHKIDKQTKPIPPEHQSDLKVLSVIVDVDKNRFVQYNGSLHGQEINEIIFIHTGVHRIGTKSVQTETTLTANSTDAEIDDALRQYAATRFKLTSMIIYPELHKFRKRKLKGGDKQC